mmetsp:Transcript_32456/g.94047  ORF Transcript_32456/g.94047 Transcript_32456/m.94047 type:complete len:101 (-) Transcript_32456:661-963(-)
MESGSGAGAAVVYGACRWAHAPDKYLGEVSPAGEPHGWGTYWYSSGSVYIGNFVHGERKGEGKFFHVTGLVEQQDKSGRHSMPLDGAAAQPAGAGLSEQS